MPPTYTSSSSSFFRLKLSRDVVRVECAAVGMLPEGAHLAVLLSQDLLRAVGVQQVAHALGPHELDRFHDIVHPLGQHELGRVHQLQQVSGHGRIHADLPRNVGDLGVRVRREPLQVDDVVRELREGLDLLDNRVS